MLCSRNLLGIPLRKLGEDVNSIISARCCPFTRIAASCYTRGSSLWIMR